MDLELNDESATTHDAVTRPPASKASSRRVRRERGQSILELAFAIPVFLVLVFGIIDFGLGLRSWITITNSAREGARIGAVRGTCDEIRAQVKATSGGLVDSDDQITIEPDDCVWTQGESVRVTVDYDYVLITPLSGMLKILDPDSDDLDPAISFSSTSDMRVE